MLQFYDFGTFFDVPKARTPRVHPPQDGMKAPLNNTLVEEVLRRHTSEAMRTSGRWRWLEFFNGRVAAMSDMALLCFCWVFRIIRTGGLFKICSIHHSWGLFMIYINDHWLQNQP